MVDYERCFKKLADKVCEEYIFADENVKGNEKEGANITRFAKVAESRKAYFYGFNRGMKYAYDLIMELADKMENEEFDFDE